MGDRPLHEYLEMPPGFWEWYENDKKRLLSNPNLSSREREQAEESLKQIQEKIRQLKENPP